MTDKTPSEIATDIAEQLQGTSGNLISALAAIEREGLQDNAEFCATLDSLVFECQTCAWWCEQSEMADREDEEWICQECTDDE